MGKKGLPEVIYDAFRLFYVRFERIIVKYKHINKVYEMLLIMLVLFIIVALLIGVTYLSGLIIGKVYAFIVVIIIAIFIAYNLYKVERGQKENGKKR